jgi:CRISPR-associated protein Csm3
MIFNRYRIECELVAQSPTHVGTGETRPVARPKKSDNAGDQESTDITMIARDCTGLPYLPGSSLRGVVRNYLLQIFRHLNPEIAHEENYEGKKFKEKTQVQIIDEMLPAATLLEKVFGTPFWAGKVEFWDAPALNRIYGAHFVDKEWDDERRCYLVRSVAIDPITGTAENHKLYTFEVAPAGIRYQVNIVGQNLEPEELGFLLFGLSGFNSEIYPLTIGAMAGRGFGQMRFEVKNIYALTQEGLSDWVKEAATHDHAGYSALKCLEEPLENIIKPFKERFLNQLDGGKVS